MYIHTSIVMCVKKQRQHLGEQWANQNTSPNSIIFQDSCQVTLKTLKQLANVATDAI